MDLSQLNPGDFDLPLPAGLCDQIGKASDATLGDLSANEIPLALAYYLRRDLPELPIGSDPGDVLLKAPEAAAIMGVTRQGFLKMSTKPGFPIPIRIDRRFTRWSKAEIINFLNAKRRAEAERAEARAAARAEKESLAAERRAAKLAIAMIDPLDETPTPAKRPRGRPRKVPVSA